MTEDRFDQVYQRGDFEEALEICVEEAEASPTISNYLRSFSAHINAERSAGALAALDALDLLDLHLRPFTAHMRGYLRCDEARRLRLREPEAAARRASPVQPGPHAVAWAKVFAQHAAKDHEGTREALAAARALAPAVPGVLTFYDGQTLAFDDITNSHDVIGPFIEFFTGDQLLDVAMSMLKALHFGPPKAAWDGLWRPTTLTLVGGLVMTGRVSCMYAGSATHDAASVRTGRETVWDRDHGYAVASGQVNLALEVEGKGTALVGLTRVTQLELRPPG